MPAEEVTFRPCAFITFAARAEGSVAALVAEAERVLQDLGWRTRVPRRPRPGDAVPSDDRRRLRLASYREIERSHVVVHVPSGASRQGTSMHRELHHATAHDIPVLLLVAADARERLGLELPSVDRLAELSSWTGGRLVEQLAQLSDMLPRQG